MSSRQYVHLTEEEQKQIGELSKSLADSNEAADKTIEEVDQILVKSRNALQQFLDRKATLESRLSRCEKLMVTTNNHAEQKEREEEWKELRRMLELLEKSITQVKVNITLAEERKARLNAVAAMRSVGHAMLLVNLSKEVKRRRENERKN